MEWDDSEDTPPSFLNEDTFQPDQTVDKIIAEIDNLEDIPASDLEPHGGCETRRKTSTDHDFLDPVENFPQFNLLENFPQFDWPSRIPSQEPDFLPCASSSLSQKPLTHHLDSEIEEEQSISLKQIPILNLQTLV